jgi:hypothetical protein
VKQNWLIYLVIFSLALNLGTIGTFAYLRHQDQVEKTAGSARPPPCVRWRELNWIILNARPWGLFRASSKVIEIRQELAKAANFLT